MDVPASDGGTTFPMGAVSVTRALGESLTATTSKWDTKLPI